MADEQDQTTSLQTIHRPRLLVELERQLDKGAVLIAAPAGWGKSTLLAQYVHESILPSMWFTATPQEKDPSTLLLSLVSEMVETYPEARSHFPFLSKGETAVPDWLALCQHIFKSLVGTVEEDVHFIIDDYQEIAAHEESVQMIEYLLKKAPANLKLVLSSRKAALNNLARFTQYNRLGFLGQESLGFLTDEVQRLFREQYGISISEPQAGQIREATEGWPFGLALLARSFSRLPDKTVSERLQAGITFTSIDLREYFDQEILKGLSEETREFMIQTSIFEFFTPAMAGEILGLDKARSHVQELLAGNCFLARHGENLRYHNLFRTYLLDILKEQKGRQQLRELHGRAGDYFNRHGRPVESVHHYLLARDYGAASSTISKNLEYFLSGNKAQALHDLIQGFPGDYVSSQATLLFGQGWALFRLGKWPEAVNRLEEAMIQAQKNDDTYILGKSLMIRSYAYTSFDRFQELESFLRQWEGAFRTEPQLHIEILSLLAMALGQLGRFEESEAVFRDIDNHPCLDKSPGILSRIAFFKGGYHFVRGDFGQAEALFHECLDFLYENDYPESYARVIGYYGIINYAWGSFHESCKSLQQAIRVCEETDQISLKSTFLGIYAMSALESDRPEAAGQALSGLMEDFPEIQSHHQPAKQIFWKDYLAIAAQACLDLRKNRKEQFLGQAEAALQKVRYKSGFLDFYLLGPVLARRYLHLGRLQTAGDLLLELEERLADLDVPYFKAHTWLLLAGLEHDRGAKAEAGRYLAKAVETSSRLGYDFLFIRKEPGLARKLVPLLIQETGNAAFITHILINLDASTFEQALGLLNDGDPVTRAAAVQALADNSCREAECRIQPLTKDPAPEVADAAKRALQTLRSLPPLPLEVRTLGGFGLRVGRREVAEEDWRRKKAKSLLKYFIFHSGRDIPLDRLLEVLFPEEDPDRAVAAFHTLISQLRRVLEPGIARKRRSAYIQVKDGAYRFELPEGSFVDAFRFEALISQAAAKEEDQSHSGAIAAYREAKDLYRGDFLPEDAYEEWTEPLRREYREQFVRACLELARDHYRRLELEDCLAILRELLREEPWHEQAYLLMMRCHYARNDRARAAQTYHDCRRILAAELGIEPSRQLSAFFERIRSS